MTEPDFRLSRTTWGADAAALTQVRYAVFVAEQGVPAEMEIDAADPNAVHLLARDGSGGAIGTGRLLDDGRIGRMAVLNGWRDRGVGSAILTELVRIARDRGLPQVVLHAQCNALEFYRHHGFAPVGETFIEAGIAHQTMHMSLSQPEP